MTNDSKNDHKTNNSVTNPLLESQTTASDQEDHQIPAAKELAKQSKNKFYQNLIPNKNISPYLKGKATFKDSNPKGITKNYTRKNGK